MVFVARLLTRNCYSRSKSLFQHKNTPLTVNKFKNVRFTRQHSTISASNVIEGINNLKTKLKHINASPVLVETEIDKSIGTIWFESCDRSVNIASFQLFVELTKALEKLNSLPELKVIILRSKKSNSFLAGADLNILANLDKPTAFEASTTFQNFIKYLISSPKPTVCYVDGQCLGAGLEIALACNYCIAANGPHVKFAFPETRMGLIPGGLGSYLAFSRCGYKPAFTMILSGKSIDAKTAVEYGIVGSCIEKVFEPEWLKNGHNLLSAVNLDSSSLMKEISPKKLGILDCIRQYATTFINYPIMRSYALKASVKNNFAPLEALTLYESYKKSNMLFQVSDEYCKTEAEIFSQLVQSPYTQGVLNYRIKDMSFRQTLPKITPISIKKAVIVGGGGFMGRNIARLFSINHGIYVSLVDWHEQRLEDTQTFIRGELKNEEESHKISIETYHEMFYHLYYEQTLSNLKNTDIVIVSITEDVERIKKVIQTLASNAPKNCIIAVNTSAITIAELTKDIPNSENIIGLHYYWPVEHVELVEVIAGPNTSPQTLQNVTCFVLKQNKIPLLVKDSPGFYGTRIYSAIGCDIIRLFELGIVPHDIDRALIDGFGFMFSICESIDRIGLDVVMPVARYLCKSLGPKFDEYKKENVLELMETQKILGTKTYEGIYRYSSDGKRETGFYLPSVSFRRALVMQDIGGQVVNMSDIKWILMSRLLNECCVCLEEGVITSPLAGDIGAVNAIKFPFNLGGPFTYIDTITPTFIVTKMRELKQQGLFKTEPCKMLVDMAEKGTKFYP